MERDLQKFDELPEKEKQVMNMLYYGYTNNEIAEDLGYKKDNFVMVIRNLYFTFGVRTKLELRKIMREVKKRDKINE